MLKSPTTRLGALNSIDLQGVAWALDDDRLECGLPRDRIHDLLKNQFSVLIHFKGDGSIVQHLWPARCRLKDWVPFLRVAVARAYDGLDRDRKGVRPGGKLPLDALG